MENFKPVSEPTSSAEPSENVLPHPNSIAYVTARLARWGRIAPLGLARVEYVSRLAREAVLQALRREFAEQGIPFHEIELAPQTRAESHVLRLREELGNLSPCVVSITGLTHAFPPEISLIDSLGVFNRNRDTLVHFPIRQIWWMQGEMATIFHSHNPDFNRFFVTTLYLEETLEAPDAPQETELRSTGVIMGDGEAHLISNFYKKRFYTALQREASSEQLQNLVQEALNPLHLTGKTEEAEQLQAELSEALQQASYGVDTLL